METESRPIDINELIQTISDMEEYGFIDNLDDKDFASLVNTILSSQYNE